MRLTVHHAKGSWVGLAGPAVSGISVCVMGTAATPASLHWGAFTAEVNASWSYGSGPAGLYFMQSELGDSAGVLVTATATPHWLLRGGMKCGCSLSPEAVVKLLCVASLLCSHCDPHLLSSHRLVFCRGTTSSNHGVPCRPPLGSWPLRSRGQGCSPIKCRGVALF